MQLKDLVIMQKSKIAVAITLAFAFPAAYSQAADSTKSDATITVTEAIQPEKLSTESISSTDLKRKGANDFGSIMRYQPLINAVGSGGGSSNGKSGFDRNGYTGYNIRGLEGNRISLDVDGIPLPDATGRPYDPTQGVDTFGIGRDYIDPYLYGTVNIATGSASRDKVNNSVGGSVSFISKSPDDYLMYGKNRYFGYDSQFDSADRSWHNGFTTAFGDKTARILMGYSRRDGQQTKNNSGTVSSFPANWHSDSFLINGMYTPNENHQLTATIDFYSKAEHSTRDLWNGGGHMSADKVVGSSKQDSKTRRYSILLKDEYTPENNVLIDKLESKIFYQNTYVKDFTFDDEKIATPRFIPAPTNPGPMKFYTKTIAEQIWTTSELKTQTVGFGTDLSKQYSNNNLNYGINFAQTKTERPFIQLKSFVEDYTVMQPQSDSTVYDINIWLSDNITIGSFSLVPGIRYSWHQIKPHGFTELTQSSTGYLTGEQVNALYKSSFSDNKLLPSLIGVYPINRSLNTYLQYKRGVSYPTTSQMFGTWVHPNVSAAGSMLLGNPDLKTETSDEFEWGVVGNLSKGLTLRGSLFYSNYSNFIASTRYSRNDFPDKFSALKLPNNINTAYLTENRDKAYIYGGEISAKINYGSWYDAIDGLNNSFAIGYNQGKAKSSYLGDEWMDLDSVAPMKGILSIGWDDPSEKYGVNVTATFVKGKQAEDTYRQSYKNTSKESFAKESEKAKNKKEYMRIPGYTTIDLSAYYSVTKNVEIYAGIYNVTNRKYWDYSSNKKQEMKTGKNKQDIALGIAPGRTYQIGITATF